MPAAWMSYEIHEALNKIGPPHERRKRVTVLRLAEGAASGVAIRNILDRNDTCSVSTWYGQRRNNLTGWRDKPAIKSALEIATRRAHWFYDREEAARIALRQRQISQTQDEIVDLTQLATETLAALMLNAGSEKVRLEAASEILDRADEATAKKTMAEHNITIGKAEGPRMSEIMRRQRRRDGEGDIVILPTGGQVPPPPVVIEQDLLELGSGEDVDDEDVEFAPIPETLDDE